MTMHPERPESPGSDDHGNGPDRPGDSWNRRFLLAGAASSALGLTTAANARDRRRTRRRRDEQEGPEAGKRAGAAPPPLLLWMTAYPMTAPASVGVGCLFGSACLTDGTAWDGENPFYLMATRAGSSEVTSRCLIQNQGLGRLVCSDAGLRIPGPTGIKVPGCGQIDIAQPRIAVAYPGLHAVGLVFRPKWIQSPPGSRRCVIEQDRTSVWLGSRTAGAARGQLNSPSGVAWNGEEGLMWARYFVADTGNDRIEVFTVQGARVAGWGSAGSGPGQFRSPGSIACTRVPGTFPTKYLVFVADVGNRRIQRFDGSGTYLGSFGSAGSGDGQFGPQFTVAVTRDRKPATVFVVDTANHRVQLFDENGAFLGKIGGFGKGPGQFNAPASACHSGMYSGMGPVQNTIFIADTGNNRIQRFTLVGR